MIYVIEEVLQVDINNVIVTFVYAQDGYTLHFQITVKKYSGLIQKEVWKFKIKLTRQAAPEPSGLYERINAREGDVVLLKERLKQLLPFTDSRNNVTGG